MNGENRPQAVLDTVYLASCALNGRTPDRYRLAEADLSEIYRIASDHYLAGICASALERAGIRDSAFENARVQAIRKAIIMNAEKDAVLQTMEEQGIWYLPLKGAVIKDLYPEVGMREFSDFDILFDDTRRDDVRAIMEAHGFTPNELTAKHDTYMKPPVSNMEMHRGLFVAHDGNRIFRYYRDAKRFLIPDEGKQYSYHLSHEDFYIYMIAHEYKHYSQGGTGLRSLMDIYVYEKRYGSELDRGYIEKQLAEMGLTEFEERNRMLALKLFEGREITSAEWEMLGYMSESGVYGTVTHAVQNSQKEYGKSFFGKLRYILKRLSYPVSRKNPDYERFAAFFPFFYQHKIFLPFLFFYRIGRGLTTRRSVFNAEIDELKRD